MHEELEQVTEANQRLTPSERDTEADQLPDADDDITRANRRVARPAERHEDRLRSDRATLNPPD